MISKELQGSCGVGHLEAISKCFNQFIKGSISNFKVDLEGEFQKDILVGNGNLMEHFPNLFRTMNVTLIIDHFGLQNGFDIQYTAYPGC